MKYIIYPLENNMLGVLEPAPEISIEEAVKKGIPLGKPHGIVDSNEIDFEFIGSYEYKNGKAVLDISKAKQIHLDKFRSARTLLLAALDVSFMRSVEAGNTDLQKEIASKKQALRDVTSINLPDDLAGIKATWPEILGSNPLA
jgi:hypothetical protein